MHLSAVLSLCWWINSVICNIKWSTSGAKLLSYRDFCSTFPLLYKKKHFNRIWSVYKLICNLGQYSNILGSKCFKCLTFHAGKKLSVDCDTVRRKFVNIEMKMWTTVSKNLHVLQYYANFTVKFSNMQLNDHSVYSNFVYHLLALTRVSL